MRAELRVHETAKRLVDKLSRAQCDVRHALIARSSIGSEPTH
jgi:hypothetical protein